MRGAAAWGFAWADVPLEMAMSKMGKIRWINIWMIAGYLVLVVVRYLVGLPCLFKYLFGFPCPGCGMTSAVISALHLSFADAFRHHAMFWAMPLVGLALILPAGTIPRRWEVVFWISMGVGFLGNWILHLV